jgi:tRNA-dihydrouridine synthase
VLFDENVCAARDAGVGVLTVHGRTRAQGYAGAADWGKVRRAVELCRGHAVAVVGNGDCRSGADAARMVAETGCHGVMIGRGAVANPWVFWEARHALCGGAREAGRRRSWAAEERFWRDYSGLGLSSATACAAASAAWCPKEHRQVVSRLKMLVRYAACVSATDRGMLLRTHDVAEAPVFLELLLSCVRRWYDAGSPAW